MFHLIDTPVTKKMLKSEYPGLTDSRYTDFIAYINAVYCGLPKGDFWFQVEDGCIWLAKYKRERVIFNSEQFSVNYSLSWHRDQIFTEEEEEYIWNIVEVIHVDESIAFFDRLEDGTLLINEYRAL